LFWYDDWFILTGMELIFMDRECLQIVKGGKLLQTHWFYDEEKGKGAYITREITENAIRYLFENCELADNVILKDILLLLDSRLDLFDYVLGNWCGDYVREGLDKPGKTYLKGDTDEIEYLELYKTYNIDSKNNSISGNERPELHGVGFPFQKDEEVYGLKYKKGERIAFSVCFSKIYNLVNIPVKLNPELILNIENDSNYDGKIIPYKGIGFTLGDILNGIIWEISFHGSPNDRDSKMLSMQKQVDDFKSGNADTITLEELLKDIND
jgi:hypothetical protein